MQQAANARRVLPGLKLWFTQPPRPHGEILDDRRVSFLELLYDLVYVVLIGRAAAALAHDITGSGLFDFAVVFTLIWVAWLNGSLYHEIHGREDGRHRTLIFTQMGILGVLGRYVDHATGEDGRGFAITYCILLALLTYQWFSVRQMDTEVYRALAAKYIVGMLILLAVMAVSIGVDEEARRWVWLGFGIAWILGPMAIYLGPRSPEASEGLRPTDSMVERYDLFTIIVLGEVVLGVVEGLSSADRGLVTTVTGMLALVVGFGFWWNYFDLVGGRLPYRASIRFPVWLYGHLVVTLAITAAGAAMVGIVEHAGVHAADPAESWLLAGSVALVLAVLAPLMHCVEPGRTIDRARGPATLLLLAAALAAVSLGPLGLPGWLLAALLVAILSVTWTIGFALSLRPQPVDI